MFRLTTFQVLFDLTANVSDPNTEFAEALKDRMRATSDLVTAFVRLNGKASSPLQDDVYKTCQKFQTEVLPL